MSSNAPSPATSKIPSSGGLAAGGAGLLIRRLLLALWVLGTWIPFTRHFGNRGEAFWLLFPVWVWVGVLLLRAIPAPKSQYKRPLAKWGIQGLAVLIPIIYCFAMASFMGAAVAWQEVVVAVWFFAVALEILLLFVFQGFDSLARRLSAGKSSLTRTAVLIGTKLVLYGMLIPFLVCTLALHRVKFASVAPPQDLDMPYENVRFAARAEPQTTLAGWFFPLPDNHGTVLACHGVGANRADILGIVYLLRDAGFQVLCFDFRGHGESTGHSVTYGLKERKDVLGAWDYLMTRHDVDPQRVYGFALSMGASSMLMALADLPDMKAVVVDSPFSSLDRMLRHQYRFLPDSLATIPIAFTRIVGWLDADLRVEQVDPVAAVRRLKTPIFFIHGMNDVVVPADCTQSLFDSYAGPKKLRVEPDAGHGGTAELDLTRYQRELRAFYLDQSNHCGPE